MLKIFCQNKYIQEKKYVLDILLVEVLGLDYEMCFHEMEQYQICFDDKKIIINDCFFSKFDEDCHYYVDSNNIPSKIIRAKVDSSYFNDLIVIYGDDKIQIDKDKSYIGADLLASSFFMLTRWEEIANQNKDKHGRFYENDSLSIKWKFNNRPIVNEYVEFLWNVLLEMGFSHKRKEKLFRFIPTHDVDFLLKYDSLFKCFKCLAGDLFKRKSLKTFFVNLKKIKNVKKGNDKDVYDTFDFLMDISESKSIKSRFYFMPGSKSEKDVSYDIGNKNCILIINRILDRGHIVGIHPTYNSYNNLVKLKSEIERLKIITSKLTEGRQHFLRFQNPKTWQIWEDNNLKVDSTIGFYENIGFRAGICQEYTVFNIKTRKKLNLKERPLIVMDTALRKLTDDKNKFVENCLLILRTVKKYNGDFVLLWHNNNLNINEWKSWNEVYCELLNNV